VVIFNYGDLNKSKTEFHFKCHYCSCEWGAERKEVKITPPCLPFAAYMECPNCKREVYDRNF